MNLHPSLDKTLFCTSVDSTNLELHRRREEFRGKNVLLISDEQTAGKGQQNRVWESKMGMGLWMSLFIGRSSLLDHNLRLLSLYTGLVLQRTLQPLLVAKVQLKWPNDLFIDSKKCGGILTEIQWQGNSVSSAIIGIGLNLQHEQEDFSPILKNTATSLRLKKSSELDRTRIAGLLLDTFFKHFQSLENTNKLTEEWNQHAYKLDEHVQLDSVGGTLEGQFKGINELGEACLLIEGTLRTFKTGELRFVNL